MAGESAPYRNGRPPLRWTEALDAKLRELWAVPGMKLNHVSQRMKISRGAVENRVILLRLPPLVALPKRQENERAGAHPLRPGAEVLPIGSGLDGLSAKFAEPERIPRPSGCQWPLSHARRGGLQVCGAALDAAGPYCPAHRYRARTGRDAPAGWESAGCGEAKPEH